MQDTFTGYVPKVGDRVRIMPTDYSGQPGYFAGKVGTVSMVAPVLSNCHVWLDYLGEGNRALGYPGCRFFPGEVEPLIEVNAADVAALSH